MARTFITADYQATLDLEISLREALPPDHLAHFIVEVVAELDLRRIYRRYGQTGAPPYAPEILLGLLFYGYATGVYSSRKIEAATRYATPFRFIAGNLHPDHDSLLVVGCRISDHANDKQEAIPTLDAIPSAVGKPASASLDNGYFSHTARRFWP